MASKTSVELDELIGDWDELKKAYELRHKLIHGTQGTTGRSYASAKVERILEASRKVCEFAKEHGRDLYGRMPVRRKITAR